MGMLTTPCKAPCEPVAGTRNNSLTFAARQDVRPGNGDTYAELTCLLEHKRSMLLRIALRFTRNLEDAEDVVQEASLKALSHLESFRHHSRLDTWLYAIINNTAVNKFRSRSRHRELSLEDVLASNDNVEPHSFKDRHRNPEEVCADQEIHEMICAQVRHLKDKPRKAVTLCDLKGLSNSDAAAYLNLDLLKFKGTLFRGRRVLCKKLRQCGVAKRH